MTDKHIYKYISKSIRALRQDRGMTQEQLAFASSWEIRRGDIP